MAGVKRGTGDRDANVASVEPQDRGESQRSDWLLPAVALILFCIYLAVTSAEAWMKLEAVCDVAIGEGALSLCLQYGAR